MSKPKVLIADDDTDLLKCLTTHFRANGFDVICTTDGTQTLYHARHEKPDVILLDINMPAGNGITAHENLNLYSDLSGVPVFYITSDMSIRVMDSAKRNYAAGVIEKPFDMKTLIKTVRQAITDRSEGQTKAA